jgi:hypothetical protein
LEAWRIVKWLLLLVCWNVVRWLVLVRFVLLLLPDGHLKI